MVAPSWRLDLYGTNPDRFEVVDSTLHGHSGSAAIIGIDDQTHVGYAVDAPATVFTRKADQARLKDGRADWFWSAAESADIPVIVHTPESASEIGAIAERHPNLKLIVDHMGIYGLKTSDPGLRDAIDRTVSLSRFPNTHVKLSGIPYYSVEPYPFTDMYPHVRRLIESLRP